MLKVVSIEQKFCDRYLAQKASTYGIIIGGRNRDEECIFFLLSPPCMHHTLDTSITSVENINELELSDQCKKINRMLPAGVHISGLYFTNNLVPDLRGGTKIRKLFSAVTAERHIGLGEFSAEHQEMIILFTDVTKQKITARACEISSSMNFFRPVDLKIKPVIERWRAIKTHVTLSLETVFPTERLREKILDHLKVAVTPYLQMINRDTRLLVNKELLSDNEPLFGAKELTNSRPPSYHKGRHSKRALAATRELAAVRSSEQTPIPDWEPIDFTLFSSTLPSWQRTGSHSSLESSGSSDIPVCEGPSNRHAIKEEATNMSIHGRIPGVAFLPLSSTCVADALVAFRRDLTNSVLTRLELLTEELLVTCGQLEMPDMLLPQRVLIRIPACPSIPLSDYKFISETPDDVIKRVSMFCQPFGSPRVRSVCDGDNSDASGSIDEDELEAPSDFLFEPAFDASCLDTRFERAFEGRVNDDLSDADIIEDIEEISQSVSKSWKKILFVAGAIVIIFLSICMAAYRGSVSS